MEHDSVDAPDPTPTPEPDDAGMVELYWARPPGPAESPSLSELWIDLGAGD